MRDKDEIWSNLWGFGGETRIFSNLATVVILEQISFLTDTIRIYTLEFLRSGRQTIGDRDKLLQIRAPKYLKSCQISRIRNLCCLAGAPCSSGRVWHESSGVWRCQICVFRSAPPEFGGRGDGGDSAPCLRPSAPSPPSPRPPNSGSAPLQPQI